MTDILIMGEAIVEIMRDKEGEELYKEGLFRGPFPSGAPAICASAAARLGSRVALISGVGDDDFGKCILDRMKELKIDTSHVIVNKTVSTGCAFVTYFSDGSRKFLFHMGNTPAVEAKAPGKDDFEYVKFMHIMGCSLMAKKEFADEILKTMHIFEEKGADISFDPNIRTELKGNGDLDRILEEVLTSASIFLPGREELLTFTGQTDVASAVRKCFTYPKMKMVVMKDGSRGSTLFTKDGESVSCPVYKVEQADPTGAGDCFDGAFLASLVQDIPLLQALKTASAAGALNAAAFGPMEGDISPETITTMIDG
ncbi:MAG: sugar kinase [Lachnospiraceae bacterium]|nr:sugar kinase [Lachnospiraceae bacterium]